MAKHKTYTSSDIKRLEWPDTIRLRPGMYLGHVNINGFINNLKGVLTSSLNILGSDTFSFELIDTHTGIFKFQNIKYPIRNQWSKWSPNPLQPFLIELSVLNALSEVFIVELLDRKSNTLIKQEFTKGVLVKGEPLHNPVHSDYFTIRFTLDKDIWGSTFQWHQDYINTEIKEFTYLFKNIKFKMLYSLDNTPCQSIYYFKNGLYDKVKLAKLKDKYNDNPIIYLDQFIHGFRIEIAFILSYYSYSNHTVLNSYVNTYKTTMHGSHVDGLLKGIRLGFKNYIKSNTPEGDYKITKATLRKNIIAEINIHLDSPCFIGCTREQLDNPEIIKPITQLVSETLYNELLKDSNSTQKLLNSFKIYD